MGYIGYYNGILDDVENIQVPMLERSNFFGDGVYDATITHKGVMLYIEDHIDRFFNSMAIMRIQPDFAKEELLGILQQVVDASDAESTFLYWQVTRGVGLRQHAFLSDSKPSLWAFAAPHPLIDLTDEPKAITVEDTRFFHCNAKTLNLLPNVLAAQKALDEGAEEAIFVRDGYVTECASHNVHILKDGALITHPADNLILPGIGRKHLIAMCHRLDIPVEERPFTEQEMMEADEVLVSASSTFAQAVTHVNGVPVGHKGRQLLGRLQEALTAEFNEYIEANAR